MSKFRKIFYTVIIFLVSSVVFIMPVRAERILNGEEVKALISDKTVHVIRHRDDKTWKAYFFSDGSAYLDVMKMKKVPWYVDEKGRHCNTGVRLVCAPIQENGDGTYSRLKPNGDRAVTWTKIVGGKDF